MKKLTEINHYESSMIASSFYNFNTEKLLVEFNGGAVYEFLNVPFDHYKAFSESDSVGKAFNEYIRQYEGTKIQDEIADEESKMIFPVNVEETEEIKESKNA